MTAEPPGLQAIAPDGARWGYPVPRPQQAPPVQDTVEDDEGKLMPREVRRRQLEAEMAAIEQDVDEAVDVITRERIKDQVHEQICGWAEIHIEAAKNLERSGALEASKAHRRCAEELERIRGQFMASIDPAEMMELDEQASNLDPDKWRPGGQEDAQYEVAADPSACDPDVAAASAGRIPEPANGSPNDGDEAGADSRLTSDIVPSAPAAGLPQAATEVVQAPALPKGVLLNPPGLADALRDAKGRLAEALSGDDVTSLAGILEEVDSMKLKWDAVRETAIGKEIGICAKHPNSTVADLARALVARLHKLAKAGKAGYSYSR